MRFILFLVFAMVFVGSNVSAQSDGILSYNVLRGPARYADSDLFDGLDRVNVLFVISYSDDCSRYLFFREEDETGNFDDFLAGVEALQNVAKERFKKSGLVVEYSPETPVLFSIYWEIYDLQEANLTCLVRSEAVASYFADVEIPWNGEVNFTESILFKETFMVRTEKEN